MNAPVDIPYTLKLSARIISLVHRALNSLLVEKLDV